MSIGVVDRKALWGRSASRCAFPTCRRELIQTNDELTRQELIGSGLIVGEEAHIRAQSRTGPRHDTNYDGVHTYLNLILLCPTHHTVIDKSDPENWPVERIERLKADHEKWVRESLTLDDANRLETQILLAADVQRIDRLLFADWPTAYWQLSYPIPFLHQARYDAITQVGRFLLAKDWPSAYPAMAIAADRLRRVIAILAEHIVSAFEPQEPSGQLKLIRSEKRLNRWDSIVYNELFHQTQLNMVTSWWLADALTCELNQWIRVVRDELDAHYRFAEGLILVPIGDGVIEPVAHSRLEYDRVAELPVLPRSRSEIRDCVERKALERGVDPQSVHPSELSFS
ncbi:HNH endonuclease [Antribacter gilvus]|uniref:HNH endonuclease n=1 Tax=Antribacter gilvus TaxID=2304675 RepID=UPI000F79EBFC|nr:HNH endonuclease [Antribacter gilvus]